VKDFGLECEWEPGSSSPPEMKTLKTGSICRRERCETRQNKKSLNIA